MHLADPDIGKILEDLDNRPLQLAEVADWIKRVHVAGWRHCWFERWELPLEALKRLRSDGRFTLREGSNWWHVSWEELRKG